MTISNEYLKDFHSTIKSKLQNSDRLANTLADAFRGLKINTQAADEVLEHAVTKNLLESRQQFDLLILGWSANDFLLGIAAHFKCPSIVLHTMYSCKPLRDFVGSPSGYQYNNVAAVVNSQSEITFSKRILFALEHFIEFIVMLYHNHFVIRPYYEKHFPAQKNYPSFAEVKRNVSLVFVTHHFTQGGIRPSVPNLIEIGGIQIKTKPSPLPPKIEQFLNAANDHGSILFSLGTNLNVADFAEEKLSIILTVFSKLKQNIIWKWNGDEIPANKPENVLMERWLPQEDILAHPNIRLFISHCGFGGVTESLFHGVPILAIPFFNDQHVNAKKIVEEGWAVLLSYNTITNETLGAAIDEMLSNHTYYDKVKKLSTIYRDRPQNALDTAIYWTEYVLRHQGAPHMQSPYVRLNFFQRKSIDVIAFYIVVVFIVFLLLKNLLKEVTIMKIFLIVMLSLFIDKFFDFLAIDVIVSAC